MGEMGCVTLRSLAVDFGRNQWLPRKSECDDTGLSHTPLLTLLIATALLPNAMSVSLSGKVWQATPTPNLVRHRSGFYYLRARFGKKEAVREALGTNVYAVALARLKHRMEILRAQQPPKGRKAIVTLQEAMRAVRARIENNPKLKPGARRTYLHMEALVRGLPETPLHRMESSELESWWKGVAGRYAPATANFFRLLVRRALKLARSEHLGANLGRLRVPRTKLNIITKEQFAQLVATVAAMPHGIPGAEWIEFVAYTGCRPKEASGVVWEDVGPGLLLITGGKWGTKNSESRVVPIVPALADLLERIQKRTGATSGRVLSTAGPRKLLSGACEALGIPRLRRYDFRHLFATRCNESGVDISSISKWLGHKDGGALALKTYVHPTSDHEQRAAAKVRF